MAGGAAPLPPGALKIKGGRWTVFRFFLVSVAFTSTWVAVSSQLGYYRAIHGPAVLLQLNIAYFLPSIPLLVVSAFLDKPLEARLGVARTILVRLLLGLLGYGATTAWFPFMPDHIWFLLGAVVALGLFSGIAFSAAYQLVARFANKNVIALGLGCSASGPLVLALQLALEMGPVPTRRQQILLFEFIAVVILGGLWATASLLVRHWGPIEAAAGKHGTHELAEPLLQEGTEDGPRSPTSPLPQPSAAAAAAAEEGGELAFPAPLSPHGTGGGGGGEPQGAHLPSQQQLLALGESLWKQRSLPPLVGYSSLEPFQSPFLSTDQEVTNSWGGGGLMEGAVTADDHTPELGDTDSLRQRVGQQGAEQQLPALPAVLAGAVLIDSKADVALKATADYVAAEAGVGGAAQPVGAEQGAAAPPAPAGAAGGASASLQALRLIWAPLAALTLSSTIALTLFPFFTYVPTSGLLGDTLPKVLFFVRIFADILGRFLPRLSLFAANSPLTPLTASAVKLLGVPIFLVYLKTPERLHSDVAAVVFIGLIWLLGGYINTMSNMMAPRLVPPQLKGAAAGAMAIAYQVAHFVGLAAATLLVFAMYGHIGVE